MRGEDVVRSALQRGAASEHLDAACLDNPAVHLDPTGPGDLAAAAERIAAIQADPKPYAVEIMHEAGFDDGQWACLESLWIGESDWRWDATNPSSGAYGIPQSLPASKMASAGPDWKTNPETQIRWGLDYIKQSYGSPCGAMNFWNSQNPHWY